MASRRASTRKNYRKASRKTLRSARKASRKTNRKTHRMFYGGFAPFESFQDSMQKTTFMTPQTSTNDPTFKSKLNTIRGSTKPTGTRPTGPMAQMGVL